MKRIPKEQVEALRDQLVAWTKAVEKGRRPAEVDERIVLILIRAILGDPPAREVARNLGILNADGHPTVSAGGRPPAYGAYLTLQKRALALEFAIERADGATYAEAVDTVADRRHKSRETVQGAIEDYRFDGLVRPGDDLALHRAGVESLWKSYRATRPKKR
jgi:hypothetical protein